MEKSFKISEVEKLREKYRERFPTDEEMENAPYDFIELMMVSFGIDREEALVLNHEANVFMGRFDSRLYR